MLHAAALSAALSARPLLADPQNARPQKTALARCFQTMDGAVYSGDPSDRRLMRFNVDTCLKGIAEINALHAKTPAQGPQKLFITGRALDRAATLIYMGLGDAPTALHQVRMANLYFRIAAGLENQTQSYHEAALANVTLTAIQLRTLRADVLAHRSNAGASAVTAFDDP